MGLTGDTVVLVERVQAGVDPFNRPVYTEVEVEVADVLWAPASTTDLPTSIDLTGKKAVYTLAIPKGDNHNWVDCTVRFAGHTWKSIGFPLEGMDANLPLRWNKKVTVELYG